MGGNLSRALEAKFRKESRQLEGVQDAVLKCLTGKEEDLF